MTSATSPIRPPGASIGKLYETSKLDRFWLEFSALIPWLGGAESDEGLEVFGRPEGVYSEAECRWRTSAARLGSARLTYFNWKRKYDGLLPTEMRRLKQLEEENGKLKKLVAELSLDREMLQDVIRRKL
jgi:putative transposase